MKVPGFNFRNIHVDSICKKYNNYQNKKEIVVKWGFFPKQKNPRLLCLLYFKYLLIKPVFFKNSRFGREIYAEQLW